MIGLLPFQCDSDKKLSGRKETVRLLRKSVLGFWPNVTGR